MILSLRRKNFCWSGSPDFDAKFGLPDWQKFFLRRYWLLAEAGDLMCQGKKRGTLWEKGWIEMFKKNGKNWRGTWDSGKHKNGRSIEKKKSLNCIFNRYFLLAVHLLLQASRKTGAGIEKKLVFLLVMRKFDPVTFLMNFDNRTKFIFRVRSSFLRNL